MSTKVNGWFPHDIDTMDDIEIQMLVDMHGPVFYAVWWRSVELLHKYDGTLTECSLAFLLTRSLNITDQIDVDKAISDIIKCGLFVMEDGKVTSGRVRRNLEYRQDVSEKRSQAGRIGGQAKASKHEANAKQMPSKAKQTASKPQAKTSTLTVTLTDTEDRREEGRGFRPPPLSEVVLMFDVRGMPAEEAERFHAYYESQGWVKSNGRPVANWQSLIVPWQKKYLAERMPTKDEVETFARNKYPDRPDGTNPELRFAAEYYLTFQRQGWKLANGLTIADWRTGLIKYVNDQMAKVTA